MIEVASGGGLIAGGKHAAGVPVLDVALNGRGRLVAGVPVPLGVGSDGPAVVVAQGRQAEVDAVDGPRGHGGQLVKPSGGLCVPPGLDQLLLDRLGKEPHQPHIHAVLRVAEIYGHSGKAAAVRRTQRGARADLIRRTRITTPSTHHPSHAENCPRAGEPSTRKVSDGITKTPGAPATSAAVSSGPPGTRDAPFARSLTTWAR